MARQYTPSRSMAALTSKLAVAPRATGPTVLITAPSMAGCVFHVTARSSQPQPVIAWMRPPTLLPAFSRFATCRRRSADVTRRLPTPLTRTRRKARSTAGPASTAKRLLAPKLVVRLAELTITSASTLATTAGQGGDGWPTHVPPEQTSAVVQKSPSSHGAVLGVRTHPVAGLQESSVQTFPSSQFRGGPPTHRPPAQVSAVVQVFPSSQGAVFGVFTQPLAGLQESSVQTFRSSQLGAGPPTHPPPAQVSAVVQALPSLPGAVCGGFTRRSGGSQEPSVQTLPSLQLGAGPPTQTPPAQVSAVVQALPSLQGAVFGVFTQPVAGLQASSVQTLPSLQLGAGPPTQTPPAQVSAVVQALPSVQAAAVGVFPPPAAGPHQAAGRTLASLQLGAGPPTQTPPAHVSAVVQALPSLHAATVGVPPPHTPAPSQVVAARHGVALGQAWRAGSNWQVGEQQSPATVLPSSHCSPGSRTPLPQTAAVFPMRLKRFVWTPPGGSPGPSTRKKFVPHGLPVIGCRIAKSPMYPAGGAGGVASHCSQVLMKELGSSGVVKVLKPTPQVAGTRSRQSSVKLMLRRPGAAAVRVVTPKGCVIV